VGFDIHRGAQASVERRAPVPLAELLAAGGPELLVAAEGLNDHENLGSLYRNAAAFGCAGVVLDPTCADPFYRRSVRVSQGNVLAVPTASMRTIEDLHAAGVATIALTPAADHQLVDLHRTALGTGPVAVLVGAEGPGLDPRTIAAAKHRASIPMEAGVDSLNVATAAAIALFHLRAGRGAANR
ncbi:MAG: TrmH family RNA methyltransferase, partial [Aquihabitans sp.]